MYSRILFSVTLALLGVSFTLPSRANAGSIYLTGAQLYSAAQTGAIAFPTDTYRHTTNSTDTGASKLSVALGTTIPNVNPVSAGISLGLLTNGDLTTFSFSTSDLFATPGNYVGINLFFSDAQVAYNPDNSNIGGHLTVATTVSSTLETASGSFIVVPSTIGNQPVFVQNYAFHSAPNTAKPQANGLAVYDVSGTTVEVSSFKATFTSGSGVQGQFTLKVVATPEPATLGLGGLACISLFGFARKSWRRKRS